MHVVDMSSFIAPRRPGRCTDRFFTRSRLQPAQPAASAQRAYGFAGPDDAEMRLAGDGSRDATVHRPSARDLARCATALSGGFAAAPQLFRDDLARRQPG